MGRLRELQESYELIGEIRGEGLMIGIEMVKDRIKKTPAVKETQDIARDALDQGVLFGTSKYHGLGNVVKIKPPAVISEEQVERVLQIFTKLLKKYS